MSEVIDAGLKLYGFPPGTEVITVQISSEDAQWVIQGDLIGSKLDPFTCGHVVCDSYHMMGKTRMDAWKIQKGDGSTTHIFKSDLGKGVGLRARDACGVTLACPAGYQVCPWCYGIGMVKVKLDDPRAEDPRQYADPEWALWCWCDLCMGSGMARDEELERHKIGGFQPSAESAGALAQYREMVRRLKARRHESELGGLFE